MRSVTLKDAPFVTTTELRLNPGLIAIIGARGSGKTALMEFLAAGASSVALIHRITDCTSIRVHGQLKAVRSNIFGRTQT